MKKLLMGVLALSSVLPMRLRADAFSQPVILELFESQGCSSCPPAERTIDALKAEWGDRVIPVVYHVDYWDALGWKDPFSDPRFTERQKQYGELLHQTSIYTPEMVVNGETGFVGSDERQARAEIRRRLASKTPPLVIRATALSEVQVSLHVSSSIDGAVQGVIVEDVPSVLVLRGENQGVTMSGLNTVRALLVRKSFQKGTVSWALRRQPAWNPQHLRIVVWGTSRSSGMVAAQQITWPER